MSALDTPERLNETGKWDLAETSFHGTWLNNTLLPTLRNPNKPLNNSARDSLGVEGRGDCSHWCQRTWRGSHPSRDSGHLSLSARPASGDGQLIPGCWQPLSDWALRDLLPLGLFESPRTNQDLLLPSEVTTFFFNRNIMFLMPKMYSVPNHQKSTNQVKRSVLTSPLTYLLLRFWYISYIHRECVDTHIYVSQK